MIPSVSAVMYPLIEEDTSRDFCYAPTNREGYHQWLVLRTHLQKRIPSMTTDTYPQCFIFCGLSTRHAIFIFRFLSGQFFVVCSVYHSGALGLVAVGFRTTYISHSETSVNVWMHLHYSFKCNNLKTNCEISIKKSEGLVLTLKWWVYSRIIYLHSY